MNKLSIKQILIIALLPTLVMNMIVFMVYSYDTTAAPVKRDTVLNLNKISTNISKTMNDINKQQIEALNNKIKEYESMITFKDTEEDYPGYYTGYMDLEEIRTDITANDMNNIINHFMDKAGITDSKYENQGQAFIDASKATGYDPIFLFGLAMNESGIGVSKLHSDKNNPYSLAMTDTNPGGGLVLGDTYSDGIINGAIYIHEHWYDKGRTTLNAMVYEGNYSSSKGKWVSDITNIMEESYDILNERNEE